MYKHRNKIHRVTQKLQGDMPTFITPLANPVTEGGGGAKEG